MTAHIYAAARAERENCHPLTEQDERMLVGWLLEQSSTTSTEQLVAKFESLRCRRLERGPAWDHDPKSGKGSRMSDQ